MPPSISPVVIRFGRLGDTILLQPLLHKLHLRYGLPCRALLLGEWSAPMYAGQPDVGQVVPIRSQNGALWASPSRLRAVLALRRMRGAPFYICENEPRFSTKVRPMLRLAGIPDEQCEFITSMPHHADEHQIDWLTRFGDRTPAAFQAAYGATQVEVTGASRLLVTPAERADCDEWLKSQGLSDRPLIPLQPANKRTMRWNGIRHPDDDDKSWPVESWAALARAIVGRIPEAQLLLCGSPDEKAYLETICAAAGIPSMKVVAGDLPLPRLKALLAIAHSMVSVDTGPAHMAAVMDCPLVVLFGNRLPSMWAPRSPKGSDVTVLGGLPAVRRVCEIDPAQVIHAWSDLRPRRQLA
jgi:ADP-heptose:LPS heptosyltransferase